MMPEIEKVWPLDIVNSAGSCPNCGCTAWIVDSDGQGRFWLLCLAANGVDECVETKGLPDHIKVKEHD